jgi:hypothetical protein
VMSSLDGVIRRIESSMPAATAHAAHG